MSALIVLALSTLGGAPTTPGESAGPASAPLDLPAVPDSERWRADRPQVGPPPAPTLPTFTRQTLENGLTVLYAQVDAMPVVTFSLVTLGGATRDPAAQAGLTSLMYGMLEEGAGALDALAFSDRIADLGASFSAGSGRDRGSLTMTGLSRVAEPMMALLAQAAFQPRFAEKDFARRKAQTLASLERRRSSPQGIAFERIPALIYGAHHPYGHPPGGTPETVQKLTLEDVQAQYAKTLSPAHSALVVAGNISLDRAVALARSHLGAWKRPAEPLPDIPTLDAKPRTTIHLVDKPGAQQTMTVIGRPLFGRGHPDEIALKLANLVYGGSFSARLNMNLREAKGYTYGAHAQATYRRKVGVFVAYSALRSDVSGPGLSEFFQELKNLDGPRPATSAELTRAREGVIRGLPGQFESTGAVAGAAEELFVYDLPLDYYAALGKRYATADLESVRSAAKTYLRPELMQVLMVGDAKVVKPQLGKLGLGAVVVATPK